MNNQVARLQKQREEVLGLLAEMFSWNSGI